MAAAGSPLWAGAAPVAESAAFLAPKYGAFISSRKRARNHSLSISNPSSDHNEANTFAYALDYATFNGVPLAHAIARHFGIGGYSTGNYNGYLVHRGGATFRVQILWAVAGHFNHVHLGVRLVGGSYRSGPTYLEREAAFLKPCGRRRGQMCKTLTKRRRLRQVEARTGKGPRWHRLDRAVERSYKKVDRYRDRARDDKVKRVMRTVLMDRNGRVPN